jgi:hypothetical protein
MEIVIQWVFFYTLSGKNENWNKFVKFYLPQWGDYFPLWLLVEGSSHDHPIHVVKFEDLKSNTSLEVGKLLNFLGFPYNEEELTRKLNGTISDALQGYDNINIVSLADAMTL